MSAKTKIVVVKMKHVILTGVLLGNTASSDNFRCYIFLFR